MTDVEIREGLAIGTLVTVDKDRLERLMDDYHKLQQEVVHLRDVAVEEKLRKIRDIAEVERLQAEIHILQAEYARLESQTENLVSIIEKMGAESR